MEMPLNTFNLYGLEEFNFDSELFQISQQSFIVNPTTITVLNAPTELTEPFWFTSRFVTNSDKAIQTIVCSNGDGVYNRSFDWSEQAYTEWFGAGNGTNYQELTDDATIDVTTLRKGSLFMINALSDVVVSFSNGTLSGFSAIGTSTTQPINQGEVLVICKVKDDLVARVA